MLYSKLLFFQFLTILFFSLFACYSKNKSLKNTVEKSDNCLELKFSGFKKSACSIGASIKQYKFQNKIVYALAPGRCGADMTTEIINEKCESIGFLGGIMGNTQINGEEFQLGAFTNVIWESN